MVTLLLFDQKNFVYPSDQLAPEFSNHNSWEFNVSAGTHYAIYYTNYKHRAATRAFPMQRHCEQYVETSQTSSSRGGHARLVRRNPLISYRLVLVGSPPRRLSRGFTAKKERGSAQLSCDTKARERGSVTGERCECNLSFLMSGHRMITIIFHMKKLFFADVNGRSNIIYF